MSLTSAQQLALRTSVKAHAADSVATAYAGHDLATIAAFYNSTASPATILWRSDIKAAELAGAIVMSEFTALTALQQGGMALLLQLGSGALDATNANVRASFSSLFTGKTTLTNLTAVAQRSATYYEALSGFLTLVSGANVCSVFGYVLSTTDVRDALYDNTGAAI